MNPKINKKGFTLVEVIISIAIISIIAITMLNVLGTGFANVFKSGKNSKDYYESAGELEVAALDPEYKGKQNNPSVATIEHHKFQAFVFGEKIITRFVKSKIGNLDSKIEKDDKFLYIYAIDKDSDYIPGDAYISKDGSVDGFKIGDIPVSKEQLEGKFKYTGKGILVVPSKEAIENDSEHPINWQVRDGIVVKEIEGSDIITISTVSEDGIVMNSLNGDITINGTILNSSGGIELKSKGKLLMWSVLINSKKNSILLESNVSINVSGTDGKPTSITAEGPGSEIIFRFKGVETGIIYLNNYTFFYNSGDNWAINKNKATLEGASWVDGKKFK